MRSVIVIFLLSSQFAFGQDTNLEKELKRLYYNAIENEDSTELLLSKTSSLNESSASILMGYKAMANLLSAKFAWLPTSKLSYFNDGKVLLDAAIKKDPRNIELIFFRFSTQIETPSILGYKEMIDRDRIFLIENFNSVQDSKVREIIKDFLIQKGKCSQDQKKKILEKIN